MNPVLLIARRELGAYLRNMSGYVIIAVLLFLDGLAFNSQFNHDDAPDHAEPLDHADAEPAADVLLIDSFAPSVALGGVNRRRDTGAIDALPREA